MISYFPFKTDISRLFRKCFEIPHHQHLQLHRNNLPFIVAQVLLHCAQLMASTGLVAPTYHFIMCCISKFV